MTGEQAVVDGLARAIHGVIYGGHAVTECPEFDAQKGALGGVARVAAEAAAAVVREAVQAEREACARVVEQWESGLVMGDPGTEHLEIAAAIRARG